MDEKLKNLIIYKMPMTDDELESTDTFILFVIMMLICIVSIVGIFIFRN